RFIGDDDVDADEVDAAAEYGWLLVRGWRAVLPLPLTLALTLPLALAIRRRRWSAAGGRRILLLRSALQADEAHEKDAKDAEAGAAKRSSHTAILDPGRCPQATYPPPPA